MTEPKHVHVWKFMLPHPRSVPHFECRCGDVIQLAEAEALLRNARINVTALEKIEAIRNNIVGNQKLVWEAHALPLFEALNEAGFRGKSYQEARADALSRGEYTGGIGD